MEMNGVFAGRKTVKMKLQADPGSLLPKEDCAYGLALSVLEFDFGFGGAGESGDGQNHRECDGGPDQIFHGGIIANFVVTRPRGRYWAVMGHAQSTKIWSILRRRTNNLQGKVQSWL